MECKWCKNDATISDYREIDGITSKVHSCESCFGLSTDFLLARRDKEVLTSKLEIKGFVLGDVWHISDVQQNYDCTDDEAKDILNAALTSDVVMQTIFEQIDSQADHLKIKKK